MQAHDPEVAVEELLRQLRQRLAALGAGRIAAIVLGVLLVIALSSTWFTVQPEETGIVQRFGAVHRTAGPGLHFKFPDGIERVRLVPTARVLKEEFGFGSAGTLPGGLNVETTAPTPGKSVRFRALALLVQHCELWLKHRYFELGL